MYGWGYTARFTDGVTQHGVPIERYCAGCESLCCVKGGFDGTRVGSCGIDAARYSFSLSENTMQYQMMGGAQEGHRVPENSVERVSSSVTQDSITGLLYSSRQDDARQDCAQSDSSNAHVQIAFGSLKLTATSSRT